MNFQKSFIFYFKKGGIAQNVVPAEFKALFDLRVSTNIAPEDFEDMISKMLLELEDDDKDERGIKFSFEHVSLND